ncbi:UDP-glucose 4-epimerase GalE [Paenibacillus hunanensis]|uniref:UDP-glucose 4-epimerase GalE n=1 Tax=Paenibacillus hunanensis TaxID=539262 RepID=UPI002026977F|nr:UDP-glucose 4-epimerase GalE [Paenibacillus hunanensis]MCL9662775.1 UDP-glucose 4-epimerase GalE [Paenibacillus hunanensis]
MIAVIGGAGYIGSHTVKYLIEQGEEVVVFDNLSNGHLEMVHEQAAFFQGDLASMSDLETFFNQYKVDSIIHFAAFAYVGESVEHPAKYYRNNMANTLNLLDSMLLHHINTIVFSSTCATYGNPLELPITEVHPQQPINPYGRTKLMMEQMIDDYAAAYGLRTAALRYFNAAGADPTGHIGEWHDPETHLIPLVLETAGGRRNEILIFGHDFDTKDGTCIRDYIHVLDLADAHYRALQYISEKERNIKLNLANGAGYSNLEIIQTAEKITGRTINYRLVERRPGDPAVLIGSALETKKCLGWEPKYKLADIIQSAWNWHTKKWEEH